MKYSKFTYQNLERLRNKLGNDGSGIGNVRATENIQNTDEGYLEKLNFADNVEIQESTIDGCNLAVLYDAFCFNSPLLIKNLLNYLTELGVSLRKTKINHIENAYLSNTTYVFNCTGNGSKTLGGVNDTLMNPTRGQVVVIRGPHITECYLASNDYETYIIKRPDSNLDEVILGGFYQPQNFDGNTYGFETEDILKRTIALYPDLLAKNPNGPNLKDLQVLRTVAGIRPGRDTGVRIEIEKFGNDKFIIHNYGAGGLGYLCGLGMSNEAVKLALQ